jgi:hypothetical protein
MAVELDPDLARFIEALAIADARRDHRIDVEQLTVERSARLPAVLPSARLKKIADCTPAELIKAQVRDAASYGFVAAATEEPNRKFLVTLGTKGGTYFPIDDGTETVLSMGSNYEIVPNYQRRFYPPGAHIQGFHVLRVSPSQWFLYVANPSPRYSPTYYDFATGLLGPLDTLHTAGFECWAISSTPRNQHEDVITFVSFGEDQDKAAN